MKITPAHLLDFVRFYEGAMAESEMRKHFLFGLQESWLLYGTGPAQLTYLAVTNTFGYVAAPAGASVDSKAAMATETKSPKTDPLTSGGLTTALGASASGGFPAEVFASFVASSEVTFGTPVPKAGAGFATMETKQSSFPSMMMTSKPLLASTPVGAQTAAQGDLSVSAKTAKQLLPKGGGPEIAKMIAGAREALSGQKQFDPRVSNFWVQFDRDSVRVAGTGNKFTPVATSASKFRTDESAGFFDRFNKSCYSLNGLAYDKLQIGVLKDTSGRKLRDFGNYNMQDVLRRYAVRRSCKFLMYEGILYGQKIRYILDELNLLMVAKKVALSENADGSRKVPVCTSELRELFRYWDNFERHVTFYRDFVAVPPPWRGGGGEEIKAWAEYAHHLTVKIMKSGNEFPEQYMDDIQMVLTLFGQKNWLGTVAAYHALRPGCFRWTKPSPFGALLSDE